MNNFIGQQYGNYRLIRLLGRGGFADVYLGEHIHLKTKAALKLIHGELDSEAIESFKKEAQTIAALKHPHIVRILEFGFEHQQPFLVMDYAQNGTLRGRHPRGSRLPLPTIVAYVKQIASALAYIHANKLIHRDVKPDNMLLDDYGNVLLSDFGIVTIAHGTTSMKPQEGSGTVHYMAPEQIKGFPRPASDQYSLAVVVYEWIAGTRPFSGSSYAEVVLNHLSEPLPPLHEKVPDLPPQVEQVVFKALAKDPLERFPTIQDFSAALEEACFSAKQSASSMTSVLPPEVTIVQDGQTMLNGKFSPSGMALDGSKQRFEPSAQVSMQKNGHADTPLQMATTRPLFKQFGSDKRKNIAILVSLGLIICLVVGGTWLWPLLTSHAHQGSTSHLQAGGNILASSATPSSAAQVTSQQALQPTPTNLPAAAGKTVSTIPHTSVTKAPLTVQPAPTPTAEPAPAHQTVVDNLNDWSLAYSHTPNLGFDTNNSLHFNGDTSLAYRKVLTREAIVWHLQGMKSFQAIVYFWPGEAIAPFSVYTSSDDQNWTAKTSSISGQYGNWERYVYTLSNLSHTNFVMLQWNNLNGQVWNPQVSSVTFSN